MLLLNTVLLTTLVQTIIANQLHAKMIVELLLFLLSRIVQRVFVFKGRANKPSEHTNIEYNENAVKSTQKRMPVWRLILTDFILLAVSLGVFAMFTLTITILLDRKSDNK